jgi:hypothetical protein
VAAWEPGIPSKATSRSAAEEIAMLACLMIDLGETFAIIGHRSGF